jgi:4-hydroxy-tetrahydrodipicolinate synthase
MTLFQGLVGFPITPAGPHGRVDTGALVTLLKRLTDAKIDGIGLLGSTGTYPYHSRAERRRTLDAALAEVGDKAPIMVGIGALRTDEAVALAKDAKTAGAAAGLLAPMSYIPLTQHEMFVHFKEVARATDLPICIYNNPGATHFTFSPDLIRRLSELPTIVAIKNPAPPAATVRAELDALRALLPLGFSVGCAMDWQMTEALIAGADAWYSVLGGLFPEICLKIQRAVAAGDVIEARRIDASLGPLWDLFREFTSLRVMYAAVNALGISDAAPPRPILPLDAPAQARVAAMVRGLEG